MLKPELYNQCRQRCPAPRLMLDLIAEQTGHTLIRTPPYHPELQPIETAWAIVKEYCAARCDYTMQGLKNHLDAGFAQVTPSVCQGLIEKVKIQEDQYWHEDQEQDDSESFDPIQFKMSDEALVEPLEEDYDRLVEQ